MYSAAFNPVPSSALRTGIGVAVGVAGVAVAAFAVKWMIERGAAATTTTPAAGECPSKPYLDLVVTSGGQTPKDPYGTISSSFDYAEWHVVVQEMINKMEQSREMLGNIEPSPFPEWERLRPQANDIWARTHKLPSPWLSIFDVKAEVPRAISIAIDTACLWEQHDKAITALGGKPPAIPSEAAGGKGGPQDKPAWWDKLPWIVLGVGVTGMFVWGGVAAYKAWLARPIQPSLPAQPAAAAAA